jgi:hypothetical protein
VLVNTCQNTDALSTSSKAKAIQTTSQLQAGTLIRKRKIPPNKNSEKQHRFFSTRKRQLWQSNTLRKPSPKEVQESRSHLLSQATTCCGICLEEDDKSGRNLIEWVQCCSCD